MKAVVTGAKGFIGANLVAALCRARVDVAEIDVDSPAAAWIEAVRGADALFHLAGVNRPDAPDEFLRGNVGPLNQLFESLDACRADERRASPAPIILSSSTQAALDNPYGRSKLAAERALENYAARTGTPAVVYRLPGVFGKWCRPDYNSVVATFCYRIARDLPIIISEPTHVVELVHVDDVVASFMSHLTGSGTGAARGEVHPTFAVSLGDLADRIKAFRGMRETLLVADLSDELTRRLFGTYVSYVPGDDLVYRLPQRTDARGTLAELLKSPWFGQIFVSRTKPGVTRGHHYHDLKVEKFCVLEGEALVRFRSILDGSVTECRVLGTDLAVVDVPPGRVHSIENVGSGEMVVLFWASEIFNPERPDTHSAEVSRD